MYNNNLFFYHRRSIYYLLFMSPDHGYTWALKKVTIKNETRKTLVGECIIKYFLFNELIIENVTKYQITQLIF